MSSPSAGSNGMFQPCGVRMAGVGSAVPDRVLTNADFEKMVDTSDEWIVQRTGIHERRVIDLATEGTFTLSCQAIRNALESAQMDPADLDLLILGTVTPEMTCPSVSCRVLAEIGGQPAGAFDLTAACSGFVYSLNVADSLVRSGRYKTVGVIGCDTMTSVMDYSDRSVSILFGDAAGSAILTRDEDTQRGCLYQTMHADGTDWHLLYIPRFEREIPESDTDNPIRLGSLRMNGREVYKFAVSKFQEVIQDALDATGLTVDDVSQFVCHQSNIRIIESAKQKIGLPSEKVHINIDKYGNSSAGSVGLCLDELWRAGKIKEGEIVMFIAFGGGMTWASSVWRV